MESVVGKEFRWPLNKCQMNNKAKRKNGKNLCDINHAPNRDVEMVRMRLKGASYVKIAKEFGISCSGAKYIISKY